MRRILVSAFLFAFLIFGGLAGSAAAQDLDCADFSTQGEAQDNLNANPGDPNGLDRDNDGIACETLPGGGGSEDTAAEEPVAGEVVPEDTASDVAAEDTDELPATGTGPITGQGSTALMTLLAAGALLCAGAGYHVRAKTLS